MAKKKVSKPETSLSDSLLVLSALILVISGAFAIAGLEKAREEDDTSIVAPIAATL
ncbi:hypothetical protein [Paenibacillus sp. 1011MAR3C5]|uniref:hypothetical protein n=1 Tax=Paenibacillus sp. 1011MAR3C5 TaxID=1675787 RepID=UPI001601F31B|nr:hypothetical protein [Paenibacillus sp. 1011MAR3C5]